uniref:Retroviral polymerase SH3-like domain-containing protein n=1 Tax=Strigamia maritima TaxID=126957 RepID=T1IY17_STRMM
MNARAYDSFRSANGGTMFDSVHAMLAETGLPHRLWAELSLTFAYLKNRSPHSSLDFKVPYVKWKQRRLSLRHLKRPGTKCFVYHTAPGRGKLEDLAWVGVLVGYAFGTRGYRVWDPATDRVVQTKHVKIDETIIYKHFGRQQEVESLQTADSSPVTERNWPKPLSDSSDDSSSADSDDDSPAPVMTTPERNLLLASIPDATSVEDSQSSTSQSGGRLTDALLYITTSKPILKQSTGRRELDLPQSDNIELDDQDNGDFEDAESLPTNELKRRVNFPWRLIGGSSIYSHWRREEHLRQDGSGRVDVYYYPTPKIRLRSMKDVNADCTQAGILYDYQRFNFTPIENHATFAYQTEPDHVPQVHFTRVEPQSYAEAMKSADAKQWQEAVQEELETFKERDVYVGIGKLKHV